MQKSGAMNIWKIPNYRVRGCGVLEVKDRMNECDGDM